MPRPQKSTLDLPRWEDEWGKPTGEDVKGFRKELNDFLEENGFKALTMNWWASATSVSRETWFRWESGRGAMPPPIWAYINKMVAPRIRSQVSSQREAAKGILAESEA